MKNADNQTSTWLKENGINPKHFASVATQILQAQKLAYNILKEHGRLLGQNEAASLNNFLRKANNKKLCEKITIGQCFKIMNIGTAVNRKLFKAYKAI
jgi:hypothetical protein